MLARGLAGGLAVLVVLALTAARDERAFDAYASRSQPALTEGQQALARVRAGTFRCQDALGVARAPVQYQRPRGGMLGFAYWRFYRLRRDVCGELAKLRQDPVRAIYAVFGAEGAKAVRVAQCESGLNVYAVGNRYGADPYLGLFQQGAYSRSRYGFGWSAWEQARAAKRHRDAEGWGPWPVCGQR